MKKKTRRILLSIIVSLAALALLVTAIAPAFGVFGGSY